MSTPTATPTELRPQDWICAAVLYGLLIIEGWREGGFWSADAFTVAVASLIILVVALALDRPDPRGLILVGSLLALTAWWLIRAIASGIPEQFLPLGASMLGFAAAYTATRTLAGTARQMAGLGFALLGGLCALAGLAGLVWRWYPMAIPSQGLWRVSSTLTYADAAGLVLAMCLLVSLGLDLAPVLVRIAVCLSAAGLLATQSRGAYVAFLGACLVVPWRRYLRFAVPLVAGIVVGAGAIASSPDSGGVTWLGLLLLLAVGVSAAPWRGQVALPTRTATRIAVALGLLVALLVAVASLHHEIGLRATAPSDQDRSVEWSTALHQWASAPLVGVGPDRLLQFHAVDGSFAHFVHNEYLQIGADAGTIGAALLALSAVAVLRVVRRSDLLASCASAALVCFAVAGAFDFDWHLSFVGLLGGTCVGLATRKEVDAGTTPSKLWSS
jgi:O-antigen ligase